MDSKLWEKSKKKIQKQAYDHAAKLLSIYAERASKSGFCFVIEPKKYAMFVEQFPYEETSDQLQVIQNVLTDMQNNKPMERLICGDVGFGKTEIAMRAAFIAISNEKQVIILVPTTLLAQQHFKNFKDRFSAFQAPVCVLSRLSKTTQKILDQIQDNTIKIIIGTHKLLQKNIQFHDVGLLVIDEEQRFGVHQKEHIRSVYPQVDTLLMSATPIPRTLNLALNGLQDLSIISTPPKKRLPIQTDICPWDEKKIIDTIEREIRRGGQVFFIEQRIHQLKETTQYLNKLFPDKSMAYSHGQMAKHELETIITQFYQQQIDILISTSIVEIGIDIPNANTIIINNAQNFGLSQLHQLRGRVGRSHHQAYAYLIAPHEKILNRDGKKRLEAIKRLNQLGIGFSLATEDLEIRGGGDVLGNEQSGKIQKIGFHLYYQILQRTVKAIQLGQSFDAFWEHEKKDVSIDLNEPAWIPEDYIFDVHDRLLFYQKIAQASHSNALQNIQEELINQFGFIPKTVEALLGKTQLKKIALLHQVQSIRYEQDGLILITFQSDASIDSEKLIHLIQKKQKIYTMKGPNTLKINQDFKNLQESIKRIQVLLDDIIKPNTPLLSRN